MEYFGYEIHLQKEPEGGYTVIVLAFPGCITWDANIEHAFIMAHEAIDGYIETLKEI
jgi:antitoxin HicB